MKAFTSPVCSTLWVIAFLAAIQISSTAYVKKVWTYPKEVLFVKEGDSFNLDCKFLVKCSDISLKWIWTENDGSEHVIWTADYQSGQNGPTDDFSHLITVETVQSDRNVAQFFEAEADSGGNYRCEVTSQGQTKNASLDVYVIDFIKKPKEIHPAEQKWEITCQAGPLPPNKKVKMSIVNGSEIIAFDNSPDIILNPDQTTATYDFTYSPIILTQNDLKDDIQCNLTYNKQSIETSGPIRGIKWRAKIINLRQPDGGERRFECDTSSAKPDPAITWLIDGQPVTPNSIDIDIEEHELVCDGVFQDCGTGLDSVITLTGNAYDGKMLTCSVSQSLFPDRDEDSILISVSE